MQSQHLSHSQTVNLCCTLESGSSANSCWVRFQISAFVSLQGHDTTSAGISWTLYLLGLHPDVQVYNYSVPNSQKQEPETLQVPQTFRRPVVHRPDISAVYVYR